MAVSESNRRKHDFAVAAIAESNLSAALKEDLTEVVTSSMEATNGLTPEQKLQSCTENQFNMARLLALFIVGQGRRATNWKDVVLGVKWPLVIAFSVLCALLLFRPELGALVDSITHTLHP